MGLQPVYMHEASYEEPLMEVAWTSVATLTFYALLGLQPPGVCDSDPSAPMKDASWPAPPFWKLIENPEKIDLESKGSGVLFSHNFESGECHILIDIASVD